MQQRIISGSVNIPEKAKQRQLHRQLGEFAEWVKRPKDASEIRKDRQKSVRISRLPMLF